MTARKAAATPDESPAEPDAGDAADAPPVFDPTHAMPTAGGCYVRQPDGSLTRED